MKVCIQASHQTGTCLFFCSKKWPGVFLLSPGWDASPLPPALICWYLFWEGDCQRKLSWPRTQLIIWLAPWEGKINRILCCDWLPEQARWSYLACSGLPAVSYMKNFCESHILSPLLTELVQSRWQDIFKDGWILALFFFCMFMDPDSVMCS